MLNEVTAAETTPDTTPQNYRELMNVLKCYCVVLQRMLGAKCNHIQEVQAITWILQQTWQEFGGITACRVSTLLWHTFMDANHFFSTLVDPSGPLPESNLQVACGMIKITMIPEQVNVPYEQLLFGAKPSEEGLGGRRRSSGWSGTAYAPVGHDKTQLHPRHHQNGISGSAD